MTKTIFKSRREELTEGVNELRNAYTDSLANFYEGIERLAQKIGITLRITRGTGPKRQELLFGASSEAVILRTHGGTDRLSRSEMERAATVRDEENAAHRITYDLLDDCWRGELEVEIT